MSRKGELFLIATYKFILYLAMIGTTTMFLFYAVAKCKMFSKGCEIIYLHESWRDALGHAFVLFLVLSPFAALQSQNAWDEFKAVKDE